MKRLAVIFLVLVGIAALATLAGILLAGKGGSLTGPTVLVWRVDRPVVEQALEPTFPFGGYSPVDSMAELYPAFRAARRDRNVKGLAVYIEAAELGVAKAQELRRQLTVLREAGKFVECYLETAGEGSNGTLSYFLATGCDKIQMAPSGDLNLLGLYAEGIFLKGTLEKLKVDPDFTHVGRYKSAAEVFTEREHSPPAKEAISAVLDSIYRALVTGIGQGRHLEPAAVRRLIDGAPYAAPEALRARLIDSLGYPDQFRDRVEQLAGGEPNLVRIQDYRPGSGLTGRRLAVVFAQGTIVRGAGGLQPWSEEVFMGSEDMALTLRELAEDEGIEAVVLRVDSPGGSALASDLILREVELLGKEKPVVVSMSDVAASGGYYISARAARIVAEPSTLTGSIGVVGGKFVTRRLQEEVLGISHDPLKRGANADLYSSLHPYSPAQSVRVQKMMERVYDTFLGHVAAGRKMSRPAVAAIAEGRVWTGADAKRLGLVDELGGLDRAVEAARQAAGIPADAPLRIELYPEPPSWLALFQERPEPLLPASLVRLARVLERPSPGLLELPPELAGLARPF